MISYSLSLHLLIFLISVLPVRPKIARWQSDCEYESLSIGTRLADRYNSLDENTDFDTRMHHDYLVKYMGFSGWIQMGLWKNTKLTAFRKNAPEIYKVK